MASPSRSTKSSKLAAQTRPGLLPLPAPLVDHHAPHLKAAMTEWIGHQRVPPVLLFTGTTGCGKREISYWLSQWIFCEKVGFSNSQKSSLREEEAPSLGLFGAPESPPINDTPHVSLLSPCGQCTSCLQAVHGNWVDFTEIRSEDEEEGQPAHGSLKVDQFRNMKASLGFGAHERAYRIILIPNAERLTLQAANSLLKVLEEPPQGWLFFLTTSDQTLLLPTLVSRCQAFRLRPLSPLSLQKLLEDQGVTPEKAILCAKLSHGSLSRARSATQDELWEKRDLLLAFLNEPASTYSELIDWAATSPAAFDWLLDQLELLVSDLIHWSVSSKSPEHFPWMNSDAKQTLTSHVKKMTGVGSTPGKARSIWIRRAEDLSQVRARSRAPLNRKLLLQDLLLPWFQSV